MFFYTASKRIDGNMCRSVQKFFCALLRFLWGAFGPCWHKCLLGCFNVLRIFEQKLNNNARLLEKIKICQWDESLVPKAQLFLSYYNFFWLLFLTGFERLFTRIKILLYYKRVIAVRLRVKKKVQNLNAMWYKEFAKNFATQGDFGHESP